jgi:hypothetical protein
MNSLVGIPIFCPYFLLVDDPYSKPAFLWLVIPYFFFQMVGTPTFICLLDNFNYYLKPLCAIM